MVLSFGYTSPSDREAFRRTSELSYERRCLVPADGFYEWRALDAKAKQPSMFSLRSGDMFTFAGVWEHWKASTGEEIDSYSIIMTAPNELTGRYTRGCR